MVKKIKKRKKIVSNLKSKTKNTKPVLIEHETDSAVSLTTVSTKTVLFLVSGILLIGLVLLQMEQFKWLGVPFVIPERFWFDLFMLGAAFTAFGLWKLPDVSSETDLSRRFAYPLLVIIIIVGTVLRFIRTGEAYWAYWGDPAINAELMIQACDFHWYPVMYPASACEPLYYWIGGGLSYIFPSWTALAVQRFAGNFFNLIAIWLCYRLGREASGKRFIGVILAALCAASKPIILLDLSGMGPLTCPFIVSLYLWFQFRLFKKPTLWRFLQWGTVLALGIYTYNSIRPWAPFLIIITLGWLLWREKKDKENIKWPVKFFALFFTFCYLLFYLDNLLSAFHGNPVATLWAFSVPLWAFTQIIFLTTLIYGYRVSGEGGKRLCGWAMGVMLLGVLSYPIALHTEAALRIRNQSLLPSSIGGWFSNEFISRIVSQARQAFGLLFVSGPDRSDMNVEGDAFFDYHADVLVLLGLIYAIVRPSWKKSFLVICGIVGCVPYLLTSIVYSAKELCAAVPLLLLAAFLLGHFIEAAWNVSANNKWIRILFVFVLLGYWSWEIQGTYERVYNKWWSAVTNDDVRVGQEALKVLPNNRVYLAPQTEVKDTGFFDCEVMVVLLDRNPFYLLNPTNVINVSPLDKRKDVTVVISPLSKTIVDRLKKEFPGAVWTPGWQYYQKSHNETPFLYSVTIPASEIPEKSGKMFQFNVVKGAFWHRYVYFYRLSLREGAIEYEDASSTLNSTIPLFKSKGQPVAADGQWTAPADGRYTFSIYTADKTRIQMDDKEVLDSIHEGNPCLVSNSFFVKKGSHHVRYSTYFAIGDHYADVTIENKDLNYKTILGSS